ncbi:hypothetical protein QVD17_15092 [Tagetes erecta]|uniref:Uncharacterized protein n=1 Tax=Tagetes erecta TaxID=13708 RepID=A0AAD8NZD5_TARER|nr:hypothetical protein QVD17_15092 [Tagetes erecta]
MLVSKSQFLGSERVSFLVRGVRLGSNGWTRSDSFPRTEIANSQIRNLNLLCPTWLHEYTVWFCTGLRNG